MNLFDKLTPEQQDLVRADVLNTIRKGGQNVSDVNMNHMLEAASTRENVERLMKNAPPEQNTAPHAGKLRKGRTARDLAEEKYAGRPNPYNITR